MALSDSEQHRLDEMERALLQDPRFAARVSMGRVRVRRWFAAAALLVLGMVVLVVGLVATAETVLIGALIGILGFLMMAAAAVLLFRRGRHRS